MLKCLNFPFILKQIHFAAALSAAVKVILIAAPRYLSAFCRDYDVALGRNQPFFMVISIADLNRSEWTLEIINLIVYSRNDGISIEILDTLFFIFTENKQSAFLIEFI